MYDSITAADIPAGAAMVAGYVDGIYRWSDADWARFPIAVKVRIAVSAFTNDGHVLDQETGNATPDQAPGWVQLRRATGADPSVYTNLNNWARLRAAFQAQGVPEPHYWIAEWTGVPHSIPGTVACQYANPVFSGGHYDLSLVDDFWPGVDGGKDMLDPQDPIVQQITGALSRIENWQDAGPINAIGDVMRKLDAILALLPASGALTAAQAQQLTDILTSLTRIETALKSA